MIAAAEAEPNVARALEGKRIVKRIHVPDRIVNFVVAGVAHDGSAARARGGVALLGWPSLLALPGCGFHPVYASDGQRTGPGAERVWA